MCAVAIGVFLPGTARVERRIEIEAPAATVFALINDFRQINQWSPWVDVDPNARITMAGPLRGAGATMTWDGQIVGRGSQVIVDSQPYEQVISQVILDGQSPAISRFKLESIEAGTLVVWTFERKAGLNLAARYFGLLLERIVGPDFEKGLAGLKRMAESLPTADFSDIEIEHLTVESVDIAYLTATSLPEATAISEALGEAYFELLNFIDKHGLVEAGAPMSIGGEWNGAELQFNAAIPVRGGNGQIDSGSSRVRIGRSYAGRAIRVKHLGSYRKLAETHDKIAAYIAALGLVRNGESWESYVSDPTRVAEDKLLTYVYYPIEQSF